jgi:hypothetical protein
MANSRLGRRGQIGPMSLEDIFPMLAAIIIVFIFIAYVYGIVAGNLEQRRVEAAYGGAVGLSDELYSKSVFVYSNKSGLFDSNRLDQYAGDYPGLAAMYGITGYDFSIEVQDLIEPARQWTFTPEKAGTNGAEIAYPVAIRYSAGKIDTGLLKVSVWKS